MESRTLDRTLMRVRELLERDDVTSAIEIIESLLPPDQADVFKDLLPGQQDALLPELDIESAADIPQELEDEDADVVATHCSMEMIYRGCSIRRGRAVANLDQNGSSPTGVSEVTAGRYVTITDYRDGRKPL